jgi:hypothetical protein
MSDLRLCPVCFAFFGARYALPGCPLCDGTGRTVEIECKNARLLVTEAEHEALLRSVARGDL